VPSRTLMLTVGAILIALGAVAVVSSTGLVLDFVAAALVLAGFGSIIVGIVANLSG
jgi:hypothetical protein